MYHSRQQCFGCQTFLFEFISSLLCFTFSLFWYPYHEMSFTIGKVLGGVIFSILIQHSGMVTHIMCWQRFSSSQSQCLPDLFTSIRVKSPPDTIFVMILLVRSSTIFEKYISQQCTLKTYKISKRFVVKNLLLTKFEKVTIFHPLGDICSLYSLLKSLKILQIIWRARGIFPER